MSAGCISLLTRNSNVLTLDSRSFNSTERGSSFTVLLVSPMIPAISFSASGSIAARTVSVSTSHSVPTSPWTPWEEAWVCYERVLWLRWMNLLVFRVFRPSLCCLCCDFVLWVSCLCVCDTRLKKIPSSFGSSSSTCIFVETCKRFEDKFVIC